MIYGIYDLKNNEQCMAVGTIQEINKFLKLTPRAFSKVMKDGKYKERYEIVSVYDEEEELVKNKIKIDYRRIGYAR